MSDSSKPSLWRSLGPGILFAGAAIGTSHLVQSTRAGATFGLGLLGVLILANVLKYPAFRFGPQYAVATGRSLIEGYRDLGQWVVAVYMLSEVAVMAIIIAATAAVTGAILMALADLSVDIRYMGVGLILLGVIMLATGGYRLLEGLTKVFVAILNHHHDLCDADYAAANRVAVRTDLLSAVGPADAGICHRAYGIHAGGHRSFRSAIVVGGG